MRFLIPSTHMYFKTICGYSFREFEALFWPPQALGTNMVYAEKTVNKNKIFKI